MNGSARRADAGVWGTRMSASCRRRRERRNVCFGGSEMEKSEERKERDKSKQTSLKAFG